MNRRSNVFGQRAALGRSEGDAECFERMMSLRAERDRAGPISLDRTSESDQWRSANLARSSAKDRRIGSPAPSGSTRCSSPPEAGARWPAPLVTFEPGARAGIRSRLGQTLIVMSGCGWTQRDGGPVERSGRATLVWISHWHGAAATTAMAMSPFRKGSRARAVDGWRGSDADYAKGPKAG